MIGSRVLVTKGDGTRYFGNAVRWESDRILVVVPEDGSAVEKRAYLPTDSVALAAPLPGQSVSSPTGRKYDISSMVEGGDNIKKYKSMFGQMKTDDSEGVVK